MKKISFVSLLLMLCTMSVLAQQPVIKFEKTTHDFGTMKEADGRVTTVFEFTNEGATPLVVSKVRASCGCTTPNWTKTPIEPGQKGNITVTYNPMGRQGGPWQKSITVTSNATTPTTRLIIKGNTISKSAQPVDAYPIKINGLGLKTNTYQFGNVKKGSVIEKTIELANTTKDPVRIELVSSAKYIATLATPELVEPGKTAMLKVRFDSKACQEWGPIREEVHLLVNGSTEATEKNRLSVIGNVIEDFSKLTTEERQQAPIAEYSTVSVNLGTIKAGSKATQKVTISNKGKKALAIRRIVNNNKSNINASINRTNINNGKKADLKIEVNTKDLKPSTYRRNITVITNDPDHVNTMISIAWKVEE